MYQDLLREVTYFTSRSSGPGGQHVNKTESRVELHWQPEGSEVLNPDQIFLVRSKLGSRLNESGVLIMSCQKTRSQLRNKELLNERFLKLVERSLKPSKPRVKTRPTRSSVEKRIQQKKFQGERKQRRRKPPLDNQ